MEDIRGEKETEFLQLYIEDLKNIEPEREDEKRQLFEALICGNDAAVSRLAELYLMQAVQLASGYRGQGLGLADLIQEANVALLTVLAGLDDADNANDGYITDYIKKHLQEMLAAEQNEKQSEEELADRINLLSDTTKMLAERFGREATLQEISEFTKLTEEEIKILMKMSLDAL